MRCRPSTSMSPSPLTSLDCRAKMVSHSALLYTRSFEQMLKDQVQVGQALYEDQTSDPDPLPEFWFLSSVQAVATTPNLRAFKASIRAAVSRDSPPPPTHPQTLAPPSSPPLPVFVSLLAGCQARHASLQHCPLTRSKLHVCGPQQVLPWGVGVCVGWGERGGGGVGTCLVWRSTHLLTT